MPFRLCPRISGEGNIQITLKDIKEATIRRCRWAGQVIRTIVPSTRSFVQQQSSFGGRRASMPVQYVLQAVSIEKLQEVLPSSWHKCTTTRPSMADVDLKFSSPRNACHHQPRQSGYHGSKRTRHWRNLTIRLSGPLYGIFYMNGKQYEILGQINRQQRNQPANIKSIYIRSDKGEMIQQPGGIHRSGSASQTVSLQTFISATISLIG